MAKHARATTDEQRTRLERNRKLLEDLIAGDAPSEEPASTGLTLVLERFVVPEGQPEIVPFEGAYGVERLLAALCERSWSPLYRDGRLIGVQGSLTVRDDCAPLTVHCHVGAGAQLVLSVEPADDLTALLEAIAAFDRHVHLAAHALGRDYRLLAHGYHPAAASPSDVVVVPLPVFSLSNAYLSRTGKLSRDMMRCTAATRVRLPLSEDPATTLSEYRLVCALAPLVAFLCDNCLRVRNRQPEDTPRMARSLVWERVDPTRCGVVSGTFTDRFGPSAYERWVEGVAPIYFTSAEGISFSTGTDTLERVMEERELTPSEAADLLTHVYPWARWDGALEVRAADALPPRQAVGYVALIKGLMGSAEARSAVEDLIGISKLDEDEVTQAFATLRAQGWDARVYGRPITQLAHELAAIASRSLTDREERQLLDGLTQLWDVGMVPRDALLHAWEKTRPRSQEEVAAQRWGEGAVIPYEQLQGEPPAGSTAVMRLNQLQQGAQEGTD